MLNRGPMSALVRQSATQCHRDFSFEFMPTDGSIQGHQSCLVRSACSGWILGMYSIALIRGNIRLMEDSNSSTRHRRNQSSRTSIPSGRNFMSCVLHVNRVNSSWIANFITCIASLLSFSPSPQSSASCTK